MKREMNATSSQDEFAKWAKLRRRHDKTLEEYDAKSAFTDMKRISSILGGFLAPTKLDFIQDHWSCAKANDLSKFR